MISTAKKYTSEANFEISYPPLTPITPNDTISKVLFPQNMTRSVTSLKDQSGSLLKKITALSPESQSPVKIKPLFTPQEVKISFFNVFEGTRKVTELERRRKESGGSWSGYSSKNSQTRPFGAQE